MRPLESIIHQVWFQGISQLPSRYLPGIASWKHQNPSYDHLLWDENSLRELLETHFPYYAGRWEHLQPLIKRCDAARYFLLYLFGGIYADLDTYALRPIDSLLSDLQFRDASVLLSEESHDPRSWKSGVARELADLQRYSEIVGNAIIISRSRQTFWLEFLEASFARSHRPVLESFSTWHLTEFLARRPSPEVRVIPARHLLDRDPYMPDAFAVHYYEATWFDHSKPRPWEA